MELTESQKSVINIKDKNMLVSASAGSGKTFVVIQRILDKIIKERESVENLLVVTFTNAAAYELKERLIKNLYEYLDNLAIDKKQEREYILKQINRVPISAISTIHAFCLSVIKDNFYLIGTSPSANIIDEANSKLVILECIMEVLEQEYSKKSDIFIDMLTLFKSEDNIINILDNLYKYYLTMPDGRDWLESAKKIYLLSKDEIEDLSDIEIGKNLLEVVKEKIDIICIELEKVLDKIEGIDEFKTRWDVLNNILKKIQDARNISKYDDMFNFVLTIDVSERLPSSKVSSEELREEVKNVKSLISKQINDISKIIYKDTKGIIDELNSMHPIINLLCDMLYRIDEKYTARKKEKQVIDFSDIEHLALKALDDDNICDMYKKKINEIYIDEYQDTSLIQEAIINKIKKDNNLIMVGDVKQSIYGFRQAKPELFIQKYLSFSNDIEDNENNMKVILGENFRSRKEIIDSVNYIFSKSMTLKCGGIDYTDDEKLICGVSEKSEETDDGYITEINIIHTKQQEKGTYVDDEDEAQTEENKDIIKEMKKVEIESKFVADKIINMTNDKDGFKVFDTKLGEYRKCEYRDIVILMRSTTNTSTIVENELKSKNIPVYADTGTGFFKSEEINLIISFLKLVNNTYDDISLASIMYSVIGSFTLDELTEIRIDNKNMYLIESIYKYIDSGKDEKLIHKLIGFIDLINKYTSYLSTYSLSEIIVKIYEETGIYDAMLLENDFDVKQANLDAFIDIVSNYEKKEISSLVTFLGYIDNLSKKGGSSDSPKVIGENENVVRIMTIHKSKGLEFPVVILMNANKKYNELDMREDILRDEKLGIGVNILNKEYNISYPSVIKQVIKSKIRTDMISEELRLLYVAMTRAKDKLLIYGTVPNYEKFRAKLVSSSDSMKLSVSTVKSCNSYLKLIMEVLNLKQDRVPFRINISAIGEKIADIIKVDEDNTLKRGQSVSNKLNNIIGKDFIDIDEKYLDSLSKKYNLLYKYEDGLNVQQKYTATELKKKGEQKGALFTSCTLSNLKPNILEESINETTYGTFIHKVIENIDMRNVSKDEIDASIEKELLKLQIRDNINKEKVSTKIQIMLKEISHLLYDAKEIYKEYEFVIDDDLKEIEELKLKQKTLIQGVIDLYIITKDNDHIVIDYKTDRIEKDQDLIDRYKYQLYIYKRAIEVSHDTKVKDMYIYSFYLDKLIKVI